MILMHEVACYQGGYVVKSNSSDRFLISIVDQEEL